MSTANPTPLRVGARGTLHGWTVTVVGRVVLGVEVAGERYYWSEYNLVDARGNSGTLVYEEGEDGPEWKLFQLLEPAPKMTLDEAAAKRVGDRVSFGGAAIPVTLVDRSRVYHIEGTAPEGVEVGDLADFFNADAGDHMIVASWTGNEIEFYEGRDVPAGTIASAFGLPRGSPALRAAAPTSAPFTPGTRRSTNTVMVVFGALAVVALVAMFNCSRSPRRAAGHTEPPRATQPAPALRLAPGASGALGERTYLVGGHALVQIGRVGGRYERREYVLVSPGAEPALLINGMTGGVRQWHLLHPAAPPPDFTAYAAAARRKGNSVNLGGATATVTELFLSQIRTREGAGEPALVAGKTYGFIATGGAEWWLARWSEQGLALYRGTALDEKTVFSALGPGPEQPR
jgi:hypothetical protein